MSSFDDYVDEMPEELEFFVAGVRAAATRMPNPSPTLAHLLTTGVSSPKPNRSVIMRVKTYVAGLGVAAKVVLGAGVAATTATAATVAPFELSKTEQRQTVDASGGKDDQKDHRNDKPVVIVDKTTTTTTAKPAEEPQPRPTTTTVKPVRPTPDKPATTTTAKPYVEPRPDKTTTTTSTKPRPPEPLHDITLTCESDAERTKVFCAWTATASPEHVSYKLVRTNADGSDWQKLYRSEDVREYWDTTPIAGKSYKYFVYSLRADGAVVAESNVVYVTCC